MATAPNSAHAKGCLAAGVRSPAVLVAGPSVPRRRQPHAGVSGAVNRLGCGLASYTSHLDSCGIFREAVISILATVAKQERVRISERVTAGLERARSKGKRLGRPQRNDVSAHEIHALRESGKSWRGIAKELAIRLSTVVDMGRRA